MQKLQLSIPEPCHENWQLMTPTDQGRFCNACAKEVVDFSMMTDTEVLNYFTTLTHEKVCGRALPDQLNRTISRLKDPKKRLFWYWNYIVMFFMFFGKGNAAKAQGGIKPITECSPVKASDIRGEIAAVVGIKRETNRVITGKVIDIDGNPIPFASVKIKGTTTDVSTEASGTYAIKANSNDVLIISGTSFKSIEEPVATRSVINSVLKKGASTGGIVVEGVLDNYLDYPTPDKTKAVAILKVKDEDTGEFLPKASVVINADSFIDTVFTDAKGIYKIKGIKKYNNYFIKVIADGYEGNEFTISETDFKDRKKEWEVLLRKQKLGIPSVKMGTKEDLVIWGKVSVASTGNDPLFIIDGEISTKYAAGKINQGDVDDHKILNAQDAMALFGPKGINGAILITTKKLKVKNLDTVVVKADRTSNRSTVLGGMGVKGVTVKRTTTISDTLKIIATKLNGAIKIYPNPVQHGNTFNISLKLKQTGPYQIQITDAAGRTFLQKQINAVSKEFIETIVADNRWSSGVYYVSLFNNKNQLVSKSSFIFQ